MAAAALGAAAAAGPALAAPVLAARIEFTSELIIEQYDPEAANAALRITRRERYFNSLTGSVRLTTLIPGGKAEHRKQLERGGLDFNGVVTGANSSDGQAGRWRVSILRQDEHWELHDVNRSGDAPPNYQLVKVLDQQSSGQADYPLTLAIEFVRNRPRDTGDFEPAPLTQAPQPVSLTPFFYQLGLACGGLKMLTTFNTIAGTTRTYDLMLEQWAEQPTGAPESGSAGITLITPGTLLHSFDDGVLRVRAERPIVPESVAAALTAGKQPAPVSVSARKVEEELADGRVVSLRTTVEHAKLNFQALDRSLEPAPLHKP